MLSKEINSELKVLDLHMEEQMAYSYFQYTVPFSMAALDNAGQFAY